MEPAEDSLPGLKEVANIRAPEELLRLNDLLLHELILQSEKCLLPCDGLPCPQAVFQAHSLFIFDLRSHFRAQFALQSNRFQHLATPFLIASRTMRIVSLLSHCVAHLRIHLRCDEIDCSISRHFPMSTSLASDSISFTLIFVQDVAR